MLVDKSDEETVEEETQVEQTSAASLAWVLDTCAEAVVELGHWPDNARSGDFRVRRVCGAGAVNTFPRVGDSEHKPPKYARSMMQSAGESPRGVLKRILSKLSKVATPAALESLPRLVGALPGSYYLHDIIDEIDEAHYQSELKQFKKYSPDKDPDPEEEEYWRHETKHSIS